MDDYKRHIKGYRGKGYVCPCCREHSKKGANRIARSRLKASDRKHFDTSTDAQGGTHAY